MNSAAARLKRWIYRGDRPHRVAGALNRFFARQYATGGPLARPRDVTLEVIGRRSGRPVAFPIVLADVDGRWYAVSMLGENANWVRNVRAAGGRAVIHRDGARPVRLRELPPERCGPILRRYLDVAPGARPHVEVDRHAPDPDLTAAAAHHPAFLVEGYCPPGAAGVGRRLIRRRDRGRA